jgi:hypothetical protein
MGEYRHPRGLALLGWAAWLVALGAAALSLAEMRRL